METAAAPWRISIITTSMHHQLYRSNRSIMWEDKRRNTPWSACHSILFVHSIIQLYLWIMWLCLDSKKHRVHVTPMPTQEGHVNSIQPQEFLQTGNNHCTILPPPISHLYYKYLAINNIVLHSIRRGRHRFLQLYLMIIRNI